MTTNPATMLFDDRRVLVVEELDDDITAVLTIACDDPNFYRYVDAAQR